jgi:hypothetical protein
MLRRYRTDRNIASRTKLLMQVEHERCHEVLRSEGRGARSKSQGFREHSAREIKQSEGC